MAADVKAEVQHILDDYNPLAPGTTADALRTLWLQFEPKSMEGIKAEQRKKQETVGIPVSVLKAMGKEIAKVARKRVGDFIPLVRLLWDTYGREGRVVAVVPLGKMERVDPETIIPLLRQICRTCITWEDADQLAMNALEPIVRQQPAQWLQAMDPWLRDENKWVRRAGITVVARLPMKHPDYTSECLALTETLLSEGDTDVRRAVSFAIRLAARGEIAPVRDFLARHVPPEDPAATWVLCDAVRSMTKKFMPAFVPLLSNYEQWAADPALDARDRRSVESAVRALRRAQSKGG